MHSLQALALMQEKRMASVGSALTRIQRSPSSTDWPASNATSYLTHCPPCRSRPRQIFSFAVAVIARLASQWRSLRGRERCGWLRCSGLCREIETTVAPAHRLIDLPAVEHGGKVFALVRAAAFAARQRGRR